MGFAEGCSRLDFYGIFYGGFSNRVTLTSKIHHKGPKLDILKRRATKFRARNYYNIVLTHSDFEWSSQKDVLDWAFMGYFIEERVMELL